MVARSPFKSSSCFWAYSDDGREERRGRGTRGTDGAWKLTGLAFGKARSGDGRGELKGGAAWGWKAAPGTWRIVLMIGPGAAAIGSELVEFMSPWVSTAKEMVVIVKL